MFKIILLVLFSVFAFSKNILLLNSYSSTFSWTKEQSEIIIKTLKKKKDIKLFVECMDTKVFKLTKKHEQNLYNYYQKKYENYTLDIVVATDDNALQFIMKYKESLFPKSKVFFSGINNLALAKTLDKKIYSGVFEEKDPLSNLQIAQTIDNSLKTVYLVSDDTTTARKEIVHYKEHFDSINNIRFVYLNNKNIDLILQKLKNYDKNSVMMLLVFTGFTQDNKHINGNIAAQLLSKHYNNPMLIHTNTYINIPNTNIIGGNCTDGKNSGKIVAKKILRYLDGESLENIEFHFKDGNKIYLNQKILKKFHFSIEKFKKFNPIVIKKENTFYKLYSFYINIFLLISIIILLFTIVVIKKNSDIKTLNNSLKEKIQHALGQLEEQHADHQEEIVRNTKFSTIGQMAAGITHEINTPLTYLKGTNEMMRFDLEDMPSNTFKETLLQDNQKITNGLNRIAIIVESMREMSQTAPQITQEFNVYSSIITMLRMSYNRSKHVTQIYVNNDLFDLENSDKEKYSFTTKGQRQRIEQVWTIILNNALDELVKIENFDERKIDINVSQKDDKIIVQISDNAGGISESIIENIFEPFISTKESSGIGIGLNVAKKILEEHEATITVENKNNGACFTVIL